MSKFSFIKKKAETAAEAAAAEATAPEDAPAQQVEAAAPADEVGFTDIMPEPPAPQAAPTPALAAAPAPAKKGRKPKAAQAATAAPAPAPAPAPLAETITMTYDPNTIKGEATLGDATPQFVLFVGCAPMRGGFTLFEDWAGPILHELNAQVQSQQAIEDYRLLGFAQSKVSFSLALKEYIKACGIPPLLVCDPYATTTKDALETLVPMCTQYIKGF